MVEGGIGEVEASAGELVALEMLSAEFMELRGLSPNLKEEEETG